MPAFTNQASLSYNGITRSSNVATGNLVEVLTVTKTALNATYASGDRITYVVSIVNSGPTAVGGITVTDNLGAYSFTPPGGTAATLYPLTYTGDVQYYQNGVLQGAPAASANPPLTFTGITVPANGNATLIYEVVANSYAPLAADSSVTNVVTLQSPALTQDVTASETVNALSGPNLSINKNLSPTTVTSNGTLTYTFTIVNTGAEADAAAEVSLEDTFSPLLSSIAVTLNGSPIAPPSYTYTPGGVFATSPGVITVPAATYSQDPVTGAWSTSPGTTVVEITGTVSGA